MYQGRWWELMFCPYYVSGKSLYFQVRWSESQSWFCCFLAMWLWASHFLFVPRFPYLWKEDHSGVHSIVLQGFREILCVKCLEQCCHSLSPDNTPKKKVSFYKGMNRLRRDQGFAQGHTASWDGAVFLPELCRLLINGKRALRSLVRCRIVKRVRKETESSPLRSHSKNPSEKSWRSEFE